MCSSNSSIRSSAPSSSSSRRLRSIVQQQQEKEKGASIAFAKTRMDVCKAGNRPREYSHDFEDDFSDSGKSFASSLSEESSPVRPACRSPERRSKDLSSLSKSPMAILFQMLFLRCLTTRRKHRNQRNRVLSTKITNNGDYQNQEEDGNTNDDNVQRRRSRSRSIPTNEHEMFLQLHSTSRRSLNAQGLSGSSSHSRSSAARRHYSPSNQSLNTQPLSRSSDHSHATAATRRYDNKSRVTTIQTDCPPPGIITPVMMVEHRSEGGTLQLS